jgi:hypothetical protein
MKCTDSPLSISSPWFNVVYYYFCEGKLPRPSSFILSKVYTFSPSAIDDKDFLISPPPLPQLHKKERIILFGGHASQKIFPE